MSQVVRDKLDEHVVPPLSNDQSYTSPANNSQELMAFTTTEIISFQINVPKKARFREGQAKKNFYERKIKVFQEWKC